MSNNAEIEYNYLTLSIYFYFDVLRRGLHSLVVNVKRLSTLCLSMSNKGVFSLDIMFKMKTSLSTPLCFLSRDHGSRIDQTSTEKLKKNDYHCETALGQHGHESFQQRRKNHTYTTCRWVLPDVFHANC